jgi:hypothetical protein
MGTPGSTENGHGILFCAAAVVLGSLVTYKTTAMRLSNRIRSSVNYALPFLVLALLMSTIIIYQKGDEGNGQRNSEVFMVQITSENYFPPADKKV